MSIREKVMVWWRGYEAWIAVGFFTIVVFLIGYSTAMMKVPLILSQQADQHARNMQMVSEAYRTTLAAKDQVIANLAKSTAGAANAAVKAADQADATATDAQRELDEHEKALRRLK